MSTSTSTSTSTSRSTSRGVYVQVVVMWLWLAQRFRPEAFPGVDGAQAASETLITSMARGLKKMTLPQAPRGTDLRWCIACR